MRRSFAPSKRVKLDGVDQENRQPDASQLNSSKCSQGGSFGGSFGSTQGSRGARSTTVSGYDGPQLSSQHASTQQLIQQRPTAAVVQRPVFRQFKCPVPYSGSSGGARGSLGAKKTYAGGATDLLAAIQRRVVLTDQQADQPGSSNTVSELVLYDPEEHKLQWLAQQEAADAAPQVEPAPPTAPSEPTTATTAPAAASTTPASAAGAANQVNMAWEKRVKVYADPFLVEKLRPHQREGVKFVFECLSGVRQQGISGAVLADGMGLGKTFQTIASLYCLLTKGIFGQSTCKKPLILCPTSLVQNWGKEVVKWLGDRLDTVVVDDTKADKVKKFLQDYRGFSRTGKPKVLVMSYPCFRGHKAEVYKLGIDVLMCDEAHFLKNGDAQITQAVAGLSTQRRLLMSGTPIQNDLSEFHAVFDLACPGLLGNLNLFRKTYEGPIQRGRDADATDKQVELGMQRMNELMKLCNKFMLRRTSAVLKELLPTKVEQVVFCKLSKLQLKLYEFFLRSKPVQALLASTMGEDGAPRKRKSSKAAATQAAGGAQEEQQPEQEQQELLAPLAAITALKKLCCHPDLIWDMLHKHKAAELKAQQAQQLALLRAAQKRVSARAATHAPKNYGTYGSGDADDEGDEEEEGPTKGGSKKRSSKKASGSARQQLTGFEGCATLFGDTDIYPAYQQGRCQAFHSGKVMVLEALLKSIRTAEPTDKVVLVSNYTEALDVLGVMCRSHNWVSLRLDGSCSVKQRQALVDTFNDPQHPSFVLLLSSKAGGVGLNIIGANRLVLFDPDWNPANDLQAMARVWREGQAKRVWIYRMLMAGSIEEKVLQRQLAKQGLSEALVDEVGQEVRTFSRDELRSLFKVNPNIACETHTAIKCSCDGSLQAMACCKERAAAVAGSGISGDDAAEQQGILAWAHLARALDSPDPTWGTMSSWVRDNFVTYVFSDHVLGEQSRPGAQAVKALAAAAKGSGGSGAAAGLKRREPDSDGGGSSSSSDGGESSSSESEEEEASSDGEGRQGSKTSGAICHGQQEGGSKTQPGSTAAGAKPSLAATVPVPANQPVSGLPPKPRPSAAAVAAAAAAPAALSKNVPAAARRRSDSAVLDGSQPAGQDTTGSSAGSAARRRYSAPAASRLATGGKALAAAAKGSGGSAAAAGKRRAPDSDSSSSSDGGESSSSESEEEGDSSDGEGRQVSKTAGAASYSKQEGSANGPTPGSSAAAATAAATGPLTHKGSAAPAAGASLAATVQAPKHHPGRGLPPKPRPSAAAAPAALNPKVPAAARRRSASAVLDSSQPAGQDAAGSSARGGSRCRNSAPADTKHASGGKPGSQMAAQGDSSGVHQAAAAPLQVAAEASFSEAVAPFASSGAHQPAAAEAVQEVVSPAGGGAEMGLPLQGVLDSLVAELCPQLSDGDDTPMGYGADSDDDFM